MNTIKLASIEFTLQWQSLYAVHRDRRYVDKVHFWRDFFPANLGSKLRCLSPGESHKQVFEPGILVEPFDPQQIKTFPSKELQNSRREEVIPVTGKFYPQGWAWKPLNCFPQNLTPFRVIDTYKELVVVDTNHPLAKYPLTLEAKVIHKWQPSKERGGGCNDIASLLASDGPGMQLPYQWASDDFYSPYPFHRVNGEDDSLFYSKPRMVNHLDDTAIEQVKVLHGRLFAPGIKVLDVMSSWVTHLPSSHESCKVTGLGLNDEELQANRQLESTVVQDLNKNPVLPFADNTFEAVICSASIEYLTRPLDVLAEIARVTQPGGVFITTFSDRWFPGKEIEPWAGLHRFERQGLVLDYYMKTKRFEDIGTESIIGLPRPITDKYSMQTNYSDPIFAVWATVSWPK